MVNLRKSLDLRQDVDGQFSVSDLRKVPVKNLEEARQYLNMGLNRRATSSTSMNNQSSRSHSIFQIHLERETESGITLRSKLRIVDLAGSEKYTIRKDMSHQEKIIKVQELTSINSSLSALG
jgi:Kinesin motor domain